MIIKKKSKIFILDTSAILSGKPINFKENKMITSNGVSNELKPGGRDYNTFQLLIEKGLRIEIPTDISLNKIKEVIKKTGDYKKLSKTDIEILALAIDKKNLNEYDPIIITDDYSIQNVSNNLNIKFEPISQSGITKRFIWTCRCRGCGKKFKENINICPICGTETKAAISGKKMINK
jgi:UPF0271 protein